MSPPSFEDKKTIITKAKEIHQKKKKNFRQHYFCFHSKTRMLYILINKSPHIFWLLNTPFYTHGIHDYFMDLIHGLYFAYKRQGKPVIFTAATMEMNSTATVGKSEFSNGPQSDNWLFKNFLLIFQRVSG